MCNCIIALFPLTKEQLEGGSEVCELLMADIEGPIGEDWKKCHAILVDLCSRIYFAKIAETATEDGRRAFNGEQPVNRK